jgi:hypothetical protein
MKRVWQPDRHLSRIQWGVDELLLVEAPGSQLGVFGVRIQDAPARWKIEQAELVAAGVNFQTAISTSCGLIASKVRAYDMGQMPKCAGRRPEPCVLIEPEAGLVGAGRLHVAWLPICLTQSSNGSTIFKLPALDPIPFHKRADVRRPMNEAQMASERRMRPDQISRLRSR